MRMTFIFWSIMIFVSVKTYAQDFRFSQWEANQALHHTTPFELSENEGQLLLAYRTQWLAVAPFRNMILSYQHRINVFTIGAKLIQNDAGEASFKNTRLLADFSYQKRLNNIGDFIALGISGGAVQQRFQPELFKFDSQYIAGEGFDASMINGESFFKTRQFVPVLSASIVGVKSFERFKTSAGFSLNNINQPKFKFGEEISTVIPAEIAFFTIVSLPCNEVLETSAYLNYNQSSILSEQIIGLRINYALSDYNKINMGLSSRIRDAVILEAGMSIYDFSFALSYDLQHADVSRVGKFNGNFELIIKYNFKK